MSTTFDELYDIAKKTLNPRRISKTSRAGHVASAILSGNAKIYTGVCIVAPCGMGFCAEHSAIASMITDGETRVVKLIAVYKDGRIIAPCGRCREFICQINDENDKCEVMLDKDKVVTMYDLLHNRWYNK